MNVQNHYVVDINRRVDTRQRTVANREFELNVWDVDTPDLAAWLTQRMNPVVRFAAALVAVLAVAGTLSL